MHTRNGPQDITLVGAGGFAREACNWAEASTFYVSKFIDETGKNKEIFGKKVYPSFLRSLKKELFFAAVGDPKLRVQLTSRALDHGLQAAPCIIHPTVVLGHDVVVCPNSIICPNAILTTNVYLGPGALVNIGVTIGHDVKVGSFVTFSPGANISGNVTIGDLCYIGTNAAIREGVKICDNVVIGMGSVVIKDITEPGVYVGCPARKMM